MAKKGDWVQVRTVVLKAEEMNSKNTGRHSEV